MEPPESSPLQPLPEGEGKEEVKEADELKLGVAKDTATETSDVESPIAAQRRLIEGEGELEVEEHQEGDRMTTESLLIGSLFEQEGDRENKYYAKSLDVESWTAAQRRHIEGAIEVHQGDVRMAIRESPQEANPFYHKTSTALDVESLLANQRQLVSEGFFRNFWKKVVRACLLCRSGDAATTPRKTYQPCSKSMSSVEEPTVHSTLTTSIDEHFVPSAMIARGDSSDMMSHTEPLAEQNRLNINSRYIHKVHPGLRSHGEIAKHYEPILVSIGPYHHGKEALQDMEKKKIKYMQVLLERVKEESIDVYEKALKNGGELEQALHCYVDTFTMAVNSFPDCVVLDGLFMIEIFRRTKKSKDYDDKDMFFTMKWMTRLLQRDLLLFDNQIPLFVLRQLFKLTKEINSEMDFVELALGFFFNEKQISHKVIETKQLDNIPHLLGLVYEALFVRERRRVRNKSWDPIWSAEALEEVGVTFVKADDDAAIYDINFNSGTLRIPRLEIKDNTESFFRNLVAYEQYSNKGRLHRITNYLQVMDYLINTPKDVELLRHCGIIENMLGDDVKVSTMFSQICSGVIFSKNKFFYAEMFNEVNKFCKRRRNVWMKKLKNEYFGSPWALISFMAAVILLLLTATQTVFAVISYYKQ